MEFEELRTQWTEMSGEIDKQKKLTDFTIIKMTKMNYVNKISKIRISETAGALVCMAALLFIIIGRDKLEPWYLMTCGIVSALILILLPVISIRAVFKIQSINISANNYKQTLTEYNKSKIHFVNVQKLSMCLGALLFVVFLPIMGKLIGNKDMFKDSVIWYIYSMGSPFLYYFARWVFKKYNNSLNKAHSILKELEIQ
jgi:hypothetical protein